MKRLWTCALLFFVMLDHSMAATIQELAFVPKYGPEITLLKKDPHFIRNNEAPDFWALMPYYISQQTDSACSVATATMIINAARKDWILASSERLATQSHVLSRTNDKAWIEGTKQGGSGYGLTSLGKALEAYGVKKYSVEMIATSDESELNYQRLIQNLRENELSGSDFIAINFVQGIATGNVLVGHWAVIGAFDESQDRVLILDPDREWYEPYWISTRTLLRSMTYPHKGFTRGYVYVRIFN